MIAQIVHAPWQCSCYCPDNRPNPEDLAALVGITVCLGMLVAFGFAMVGVWWLGRSR